MPSGILNKLTDAKCRAAKVEGTTKEGTPRKLVKLADGGGLYLLIQPNDAKGWRFKYRYNGRENSLSFGKYSDVSLKLARERRDAARTLLGQGIDPSAASKEEKVARLVTFKQVAEAYLGLREHTTAFRTQSKQIYFLAFLKDLHNKPIDAIRTKDIVTILRRMEAAGTHETAHRVASFASRVFRYALQQGNPESLKRNPVDDLRGALIPVVTTSRAAITDPVEVGGLLRAIDDYQGLPTVQAALKLAPLVFVRPEELRLAVWSEINLDAAEWRIPGERMKMGTPHLVPLSRQAVALLRDLHQRTGHGRLVFPGPHRDRPLSDNSLTSALRRMGYTSEEMTWHGFRSTASTLLNEMGWHADVIELQLAHQERNKVRAAYNKAERVAERRAMVQAYADYLDELKATKPPVKAAA